MILSLYPAPLFAVVGGQGRKGSRPVAWKNECLSVQSGVFRYRADICRELELEYSTNSSLSHNRDSLEGYHSRLLGTWRTAWSFAWGGAADVGRYEVVCFLLRGEA